MSGGYCFGIAFGSDTSSVSAGSADSNCVGGFNFWAPFPDAIFLRALRMVAILLEVKTQEGDDGLTGFSAALDRGHGQSTQTSLQTSVVTLPSDLLNYRPLGGFSVLG